MSTRILTVLVFLGSVLLLRCERGAGEERGPQGSEGKHLVVDLRRPPRSAPPATAFDMNNIPAGPSTAEERENYWGAQEAKDESLCEQLGPRSRSQCIAQVAKLKADVSLCERIDASHRWERSTCYRYVAKELGDLELCRKVADEPIRSLCEEKHRLRPFDASWACESDPGESMRAACEREIRSAARLERLEKEYWALVREYSLPHCEVLTGSRRSGDYYIRDKDECYRREQEAGNHMACLHESGPGECLARRSIKTKTFLCDAIPSEFARMKCIKYLSQHGRDLETYARAELFRSTETIIFSDPSEFVEYLANGYVNRLSLEPGLRETLAEPEVCAGIRLKKPRRIPGGGELGQKIGYIRGCERMGSDWSVEFIGYR